MSAPGPIPRACRNCSIAKAKCIWISTSKCERCNRLKKNCNPQILARQPRAPRVSHAAKIEKKLDGLMSLLNATVATSETKAPDAENLPVRNRKLVASDSAMQLRAAVHPGNESHSQAEPLESLLSENEAEHLVQIYLDHLEKQSPFVTVPAGRTARNLHQETPFLFYSIIWAASHHDASRQRTLEKNILEYISKHLILNGERSTDLLQGLMVYIMWYHYHDYGPSQKNVLLQLLIAILVDLGLNKASPTREEQSALLNEIKVADHATARPVKTSISSCRAVLGCFYLSSSITAAFSKLDPMRYNSHIESCLNIIEAIATGESDITLLQLSKLQKIVEEIRTSGLHNSPGLKGPVKMYIGSFETTLQAYRKSLPENLQNNTTILLHYYAAEIQLYQIGFLMPFQTQDNLRFQRMEILSACLSAAKEFCNIWISIPLESYFSLSLVHFDDWDSSQVRQTIDLSSIFDKTTSRMEEASAASRQTGGSSVFAISAKNLKLGKSWYERQIANSTAASDLTTEIQEASQENIMTESQFDIWNDDLWAGFTSDWGYGGFIE